MSLKGKVALVTAAGRNIGRAIAIELARQGADVAVNARSNRAELDEVVGQVQSNGRRSLGVLGDLARRSEVDRVVAAVAQDLGPVDILVNNLAVRPSKPFLEITEEELQRVVSSNLYSAFFAAQAVLPGMVQRRWGRIINFSGSAAFFAGGGRVHVNMTKVGILGLTRGLALEFAPYGITVNTIVPGTFDTSRAVPRPASAGLPPVGRMGTPEELAALCAFLVSDHGGFITGQSIHSNGGKYIT